jgi:hypothetical protein
MKMIQFLAVLCLLTLSYSCGDSIFSQSCPSGLISLWKMDESAGSTFYDSKGNHDASRSSELISADGKINGSQYFDFSNRDLAKISSDAVFNFPANSSFSIVYWLKFTDTQYGLKGGQDHIVISKGDWNTGGPSTAMWASGVNGSGKVNFLLSDDSGYKIDLEGEGHYDDGQWHQVACVRDESNNESILYVDGIIVDQVTYNYEGSFTNSDKICIAHLMNLGEPEYYYMGFVDEIAVYSRALSASEINNQIASASSGTGICNETVTALLKDPSPASFILFPVPARDLLYAKLTDALEDINYEITSITGMIVSSGIIPANTEIANIPIQDLKPGIYYLRSGNQRIISNSSFTIIR